MNLLISLKWRIKTNYLLNYNKNIMIFRNNLCKLKISMLLLLLLVKIKWNHWLMKCNLLLIRIKNYQYKFNSFYKETPNYSCKLRKIINIILINLMLMNKILRLNWKNQSLSQGLMKVKSLLKCRLAYNNQRKSFNYCNKNCNTKNN